MMLSTPDKVHDRVIRTIELTQVSAIAHVPSSDLVRLPDRGDLKMSHRASGNDHRTSRFAFSADAHTPQGRYRTPTSTLNLASGF
jgi:hypothetical protein